MVFIGKYSEIVQVYMIGWGMDVVHKSRNVIIICDEDTVKDGLLLWSK